MALATKRQLEYAEQISKKLGIKLPDVLDYNVYNKFIADNKLDFYKIQEKEIRDLIVSNVSIITIAAELGFTPIRKGNYYTLKEHDSVIIDTSRNCYWRNSRSNGMGHAEGGSVIDFVKNFTGKGVKEVIKELEQRLLGVSFAPLNLPKVKQLGELILPPKAADMRRVYAYLVNTRYLEPDIVQDFVDRDMLYQDTNGNCVFVSRENENPVFACLRGTITYKRFVGDVKNSNYEKGFYIDNNAKKTIVTESVIDAMSIMGVIAAKGEDFHNYNYLPLAGATKFECLMYQLKEHPVTDLYLALDNDKAGKYNIRLITEALADNIPDADKIKLHNCIPHFTKDWNEEIKYAFTHQMNFGSLDFFNEFSNNSTARLNSRLERLVNNTVNVKNNSYTLEKSSNDELEL